MRRSLTYVLILLGLSALACGLLDDDAATITYYEDIPVTFTIDADELCPDGAECDQEGDAPTDIELGTLEQAIDIDIIEATGSDDLANVGQRLRSLTITNIGYQASDNNLNFDLPDIDIHVGPLGADSSDAEDVVMLATIPSIPAGIDATGDAPVAEESLEPSSELFKQFQFTALPRTTPVIEEGSPLPPSGSTTITLTIDIEVSANPLD